VSNVTTFPFWLIASSSPCPMAPDAPGARETTAVVFATVSRTRIDPVPAGVPSPKLVAAEPNAILVPAASIEGRSEFLSALAPFTPVALEMRTVVEFVRSRTKTSSSGSVSLGKFVAPLAKAIRFPRLLMLGSPESLLPMGPAAVSPREIRVVECAVMSRM
jgi:hypothetical protein